MLLLLLLLLLPLSECVRACVRARQGPARRCPRAPRPRTTQPHSHTCSRAQATCYEDSRLLKLFADMVKILYDSEVGGWVGEWVGGWVGGVR